MTANVLLLVLGIIQVEGSVTAQEPPITNSSGSKIAATVILVLTQEFCTTRPLGLAVGRLICPGAEEAVRNSFAKVIRMETAPKPGETDGRVVLVPKFADMESAYTKTFLYNFTGVVPLAKHHFLILVEWNAIDPRGRVFWTQIAAGYARKTAGLNDQVLKERAVRDLTANSTAAIEKSREIRQLLGLSTDK